MKKRHVLFILTLIGGIAMGWLAQTFVLVREVTYQDVVCAGARVSSSVWILRSLKSGQIDQAIQRLERELRVGLVVLDANERLLRSHPELAKIRERGHQHLNVAESSNQP